MGYTHGIRWTYELVKEYIKNLGYELISEEYINHKSKLVFKDKTGYYYTSSLSNLKSGFIPYKFNKNNPYTIQNINLWIKLNNKPFELLSNIYENNSKKLKWKCLKPECGEIFETNWNDIKFGKGCSFCAGRQVGILNCLASKNPELIGEWHPIKNDSLTPYDITWGSGQYVWWKCKECGHEWKSRIVDRSSKGMTGCPECNKSKGEKQIDYILTKYNVLHDFQYTFDDLIGVGGNLLRFDSSIFFNNDKTKLRMLIEYDGIQHYEWVKGWMSKNKFKIIQYHDELKNKYCENHNIKLIRIPYWEFDKIEEILVRELNLNDIKLTI